MDAQRITLSLLCVRHGKTQYTGILPDLTEDGIAEVRRVAFEHVAPWMDAERVSGRTPALETSPAPRAHGTAITLARALEHRRPIRVRKELDALVWRDPARARAACQGLSGKGYIDYETEPVFADASIFETPGEVRARWYAFLAKRIRTARKSPTLRSAVIVSHYEIFCNLTRDIFGIIANESTALKYAEHITLWVRHRDCGRMVIIEGEFRGEHRTALFDLEKQLFVAG